MCAAGAYISIKGGYLQPDPSLSSPYHRAGSEGILFFTVGS